MTPLWKFHMEVDGEALRGFADLIEMEGIEDYGEPTDRMMEQHQQKAKALGRSGASGYQLPAQRNGRNRRVDGGDNRRIR